MERRLETACPIKDAERSTFNIQRSTSNGWAGWVLAVMLWCSSGGLLAAEVVWSEPVRISGEADVIQSGTLEGAWNFGSAEPVVLVNGTLFRMFGVNAEATGGRGTLSDGKVTAMVSGDNDELLMENAALWDGASGLPANYGALLRSGLYNRGSPLGVALSGLTVGKTYALQLWAHDSRNIPTAEVWSGGTNISMPLKFNSTEAAAGRGSFLVGLFTADGPEQVIACTPLGGAALLNALQLRSLSDAAGIILLKQPESLTNVMSRSVTLSAQAMSQSPLRYQWQRLADGKSVDLVDSARVSGATTASLNVSSLMAEDAGNYRVRMSDGTGSIESRLATITVLEPQTNPVVNVAVNNGSAMAFRGPAVLSGAPDDVWNSVDARRAFNNAPLVNALGEPTPITLSLSKADGSSVRNGLLGAVSFATNQIVTLSNLPPDELFHLVVFSVGNVANEGGVFSGAVEGICRGYPKNNVAPTGFVYGTNFVENPYAKSDAQGVMMFRIAPVSTVMPGGHTFGDFNGLQVRKTKPGPPVLLQAPEDVVTRPGHKVSFRMLAASPPSLPVFYSWQRITGTATNDLTDRGHLSGATSNELVFSSVSAQDAGVYRVTVSNAFGAVTSPDVGLTVLTQPLINVAVNNGSLRARLGSGVLPGTPEDLWNSIDARVSVTNVSLRDATGASTPVTLSLLKTDGGAVLNPLLGAVSFGTAQTVILSNLPPNEPFRLVVFSVGNMPNEGGVFSGAIDGICRGYPTANFPASSYILGTNYLEAYYVTADERGVIRFTIKPNSTAMTGGHTFGDFNGLQLMQVPPGPPVLVQQPVSVKAFARSAVNLNVLARGPISSSLSYRWQRITASGTNDLAGRANITGANTAYLSLRSLTPADAGAYRVVVGNPYGSVTSAVATVSLMSRQLINVAVSSGNSPPFGGQAVLDGGPTDVWNRIDARAPFVNVPLVDSEGAATPVTVSLMRTNGGAVAHKLLGAVSFGTTQTVTLSNLLPDEKYHLVVFSVGNVANEGGVFSGAIEGMCEGYPVANTPATSFVPRVNYIDNPEAVSDARGVISFTIKANSTVQPGGHFFGDFNGLQLLRTTAATYGRASAQ